MTSTELVGTWTGVNGFRLMPHDPLQERPATVTVGTAAGGHLLLVAYTWQHPDDGPQDGLVLVAPSGDDGAVTAAWGDSWHQQPATMTLTGTRSADGALSVEGVYGGDWAWRIHVGPASGGGLALLMENVVPAAHATDGEAAGPYPVMVLDARRA